MSVIGHMRFSTVVFSDRVPRGSAGLGALRSGNFVLARSVRDQARCGYSTICTPEPASGSYIDR